MITRAFVGECLQAASLFAALVLVAAGGAWLLEGKDAALAAASLSGFGAFTGWLVFVAVWGATREDVLDLARREAEMKLRLKDRGLR